MPCPRTRTQTKTKAELVAEVEELARRITAIEEARTPTAGPGHEDAFACLDRAVELLLTMPGDDVYAEILGDLLTATGSLRGVFGYIDENGAYVVPPMNGRAGNQPGDTPKPTVFSRETWKEGTGPQAIREKRTIVKNGRMPTGPQDATAPPRHVSLPIVYHGETIGLIQVADRDSDYRTEDVALLESVAIRIAPLLAARVRQKRRDRQHAAEIDEFHAAQKELRSWAEKRFDELAKVNEDLLAQLARSGIEPAGNRASVNPSLLPSPPAAGRKWRRALRGIHGALTRRNLTLPRFKLPGFRTARCARALRVLLIGNDSPAFLRSLETSLVRHDAFVIVGCADTYSSGVESARLCKPDLAVVDVASTGTRGLDAIFQLRGQSPDVRIVAIGLHDSRSSRHAARECGADDFVLRSNIESRLVDVLHRLGSPSLRPGSE